MADCSAIGSTIDRATSSTIEQNVASSASKLVNSLWNSKNIQQTPPSSSRVMPIKPPTELPNILPVIKQATQLNNNINGLDEAWKSTSNTQSINHQMIHPQTMHPHSNAFMIQQQQMQIMYQQSQMLQQQLMQKNTVQERLDTAYEQEEESSEWHDNLEDEFYQEMKRLQREVDNYEEGLLGTGVSIEELAEAWSQANIEEMHQEPRPYEFHPNLEAYYDQNTNESSLSDGTATDFMSLGMEQFQKGEIHDAILSFQSCIRYTNKQSSKAWYMLGQCHAELDDDRNAIISLEHSIEHDPYSLETLLALTVSYVNELDYSKALQSLQNFVTHNPKYAGMMNTIDGALDNSLDSIERLLLQAHECDGTDVDILQALGVCYNINREYDKAISYFRQALSIQKSNDTMSTTTTTIQLYQLWNKLGATLANSNQSSEALEAYHNALSIKPKYVRSWLNMAIAYSNLKNYTEACRCYLQTLSLNSGAEHCWNYLRIALSCLERWDLVEFCLKRDLEGFRNEFDFV